VNRRKVLRMRRLPAIVFGFVVAVVVAAFPCSWFVPGVFPTGVHTLSGQVQGSLRPRRKELGRRPAIPGAYVELTTRLDRSYVGTEKDFPPYRAEIVRQHKGAIRHFDCGKVVAASETDDSGHFELPKPINGKHCLRVVTKEQRRDPSREWECEAVNFPLM